MGTHRPLAARVWHPHPTRAAVRIVSHGGRAEAPPKRPNACANWPAAASRAGPPQRSERRRRRGVGVRPGPLARWMSWRRSGSGWAAPRAAPNHAPPLPSTVPSHGRSGPGGRTGPGRSALLGRAVGAGRWAHGRHRDARPAPSRPRHRGARSPPGRHRASPLYPPGASGQPGGGAHRLRYHVGARGHRGSGPRRRCRGAWGKAAGRRVSRWIRRRANGACRHTAVVMPRPGSWGWR
jgi:hypothetical protein